MELKKTTVNPLIEAWSSQITNDPWTSSQKNSLADRVIGISKAITPYIVEDTNVSEDDKQAYLLFRTEQELETWLIQISNSFGNLKRKKSGQFTKQNNTFKLELRSASITDMEALPGIGEELAWEIGKYVSQHPELHAVDELIEINGIGPAKVAQLKELAYIDAGTVQFLSPGLSAFVKAPEMKSFIQVLDTTDLDYFFGDRTMFMNQVNTGATSYVRLSTFLDLVEEQGKRHTPEISGVKSSEIASWVIRSSIRQQMHTKLKAGKGSILMRHAYMPFVKSQIEASATSFYLMMFLGTTTAGTTEQEGPLELIKGLESAAANGIDVRVILDQDDVGQAYKSLLINSPMVARLLDSSVPVKFDTKETLLHSKVLIVDDDKVVLGSHNWTFNSFYRTNELSVFFEQSETAAFYKNRFIQFWDSLPNVQ